MGILYNVEEIVNISLDEFMGNQKYYLGEFEEIVLLAIIRLKGNAYGVALRRLIEEETGRGTSIGAVYTTLERLEKKRYVRSRQGEATAERGGRAKRYFRIEGAGVAALNETNEIRARMWSGIAPELDPISGAV